MFPTFTLQCLFQVQFSSQLYSNNSCIPYCEYPSCEQATLAKLLLKVPPQILLHVPLTQTTTTPARSTDELRSTTSSSVQGSAMDYLQVYHFLYITCTHINTLYIWCSGVYVIHAYIILGL